MSGPGESVTSRMARTASQIAAVRLLAAVVVPGEMDAARLERAEIRVFRRTAIKTLRRIAAGDAS